MTATKKTAAAVKPVRHSPAGFLNIAQSTDAQIKAALVGVEVGTDDATGEPILFDPKKRYSRGTLIAMARDAGLWNFIGNVVPEQYKARYGKKQRCGDEVSEALHAATRDGKGNVSLEALFALQKENDVNGDRWSHCNVGQQVMNTSNVLRARVKRGETIVIGGVEYGGKAE